MPLPELEKTITMERAGAPEFSVTFLRIPGMAYKEMLDLFKEDDRDSDEERIKKKMKALIVHWTIEDVNGDRQPLPKDDPDVVFRLPSSFIELITLEMLEDSSGGLKDAVNLQSKNGTN
tara:strand:- start:3067 stop:3423 length:357 start_codon:yes stop_codon:yes gene_type:complete